MYGLFAPLAAYLYRVRPYNVIRRRTGLRLGISGSYATGKSTLAAELRTALPQWIFVEEAYAHLLEEGEDFGVEPTIDDIEAQLRRSIDLIGSISDREVVFERSPVDYLAYLTALGADTETLGYWLQESRDALASLDALIFVPGRLAAYPIAIGGVNKGRPMNLVVYVNYRGNCEEAPVPDAESVAERVYSVLADGGEIFMELQRTPCANRFAVLHDEFGASWMLPHQP